MLRTFADLTGFSLHAVDGEIGSVKDAYFDDHTWTLRYLVVTTGNWLSGRSVLISPLSLQGLDWQKQWINTNLTQEQVRNAPGAETDKPVSRQFEASYFDYYGYPYYWAADPIAGPSMASIPPGVRSSSSDRSGEERGDPNLRSAKEVHGYDIEAVDGSIGQVADFLLDDATWALRFFVVDTRKWLPGRKVLMSTDWIDAVSWEEHGVKVAMTRDEVRASPEFDHQRFTEQDEDALYRHYRRERPRHRMPVLI